MCIPRHLTILSSFVTFCHSCLTVAARFFRSATFRHGSHGKLGFIVAVLLRFITAHPGVLRFTRMWRTGTLRSTTVRHGLARRVRSMVYNQISSRQGNFIFVSGNWQHNWQHIYNTYSNYATEEVKTKAPAVPRPTSSPSVEEQEQQDDPRRSPPPDDELELATTSADSVSELDSEPDADEDAPTTPRRKAAPRVVTNFTEEEKDIIIDFLQQNPTLYSKRLAGYKDAAAKDRLWTEQARHMQRTPNEIKTWILAFSTAFFASFQAVVF